MDVASVSLFGNNFPEATPIMGISSFNPTLGLLSPCLRTALSDCMAGGGGSHSRHSHAIKVPLRGREDDDDSSSSQLCGGREE